MLVIESLLFHSFQVCTSAKVVRGKEKVIVLDRGKMRGETFTQTAAQVGNFEPHRVSFIEHYLKFLFQTISIPSMHCQTNGRESVHLLIITFKSWIHRPEQCLPKTNNLKWLLNMFLRPIVPVPEQEQGEDDEIKRFASKTQSSA